MSHVACTTNPNLVTNQYFAAPHFVFNIVHRLKSDSLSPILTRSFLAMSQRRSSSLPRSRGHYPEAISNQNKSWPETETQDVTQLITTLRSKPGKSFTTEELAAAVELLNNQSLQTSSGTTATVNSPEAPSHRSRSVALYSIISSLLATVPDQESIPLQELSMTPTENSEQIPSDTAAAEHTQQSLSSNDLPVTQSPVQSAESGSAGSQNFASALTLTSQWTSLPNFPVWILLGLSMLITSITVYYCWNASLASSPSARFLWNQPETTVFTINLLSYISTVLVSNLVSYTGDQLRWAKSCREEGFSFLSFLALSSATSVAGLVHLLFSPRPSVNSSKAKIKPRWWSLQRY
jgi:hypothetical protein